MIIIHRQTLLPICIFFDQEDLFFFQLTQEGLLRRLAFFDRPTDQSIPTISAMKREGEFDENPNNQVEVSSEEYRWVRKRAKELASIGLNKVSIARVLEHESERNVNAIRRIVWELEKRGQLEIRERKRMASREIEGIILRRAKFLKAGWKDQTIANRIARDMGRKATTIKLIIHRIVTIGGCEENPKG